MQSEVINDMVDQNAEEQEGYAPNSSDGKCGAVSNKIAQGISQGTLDLFGSQVSNMSYTCSEVIENDEQFNKTVLQDSSKPGGSISLIDEEPVVYDSKEKGSITDKINEYLDN